MGVPVHRSDTVERSAKSPTAVVAWVQSSGGPSPARAADRVVAELILQDRFPGQAPDPVGIVVPAIGPGRRGTAARHLATVADRTGSLDLYWTSESGGAIR